MPVAIKKDTTTNVLEDVAIMVTDTDALNELSTTAAFTATPLPTMTIVGADPVVVAPTLTSIVVANGVITGCTFSDRGAAVGVNDVLVFKQGDVYGEHMLRNNVDFTTSIFLSLSTMSVTGRTAGAGKRAQTFPNSDWLALSEKPLPNGDWKVDDDFTVSRVTLSDLETLKKEAFALHAWLNAQSVDIEKYGHFYPDDARHALHDGEAQAHRGNHVILLRKAPSVEALTVAQRLAYVRKMREGFADAATIQAAYPRVVLAGVARKLQGLTPVVRFPDSPITWVDPRTDPPEAVNVADVIDFSGAAGYTKSDNTVVTGLNLLTTQTDLTADYSTADWIYMIPGNVPTKLRNFTVTPTSSKVDVGTTTSVVVTWDLPASDSGLAITGITLIHTDDDTPTPVVASVGPTATTYTFTNMPPGAHTIMGHATNADGTGAITHAIATILQNNAPVVDSPVADVTLDSTTGTHSVTVADVFSDPDGDTLTVTAGTSNTHVATAHMSLSGATATVQGVSAGTATITLTASDGTLSVSDSFDVTVPSTA